MRVPTLTPPAPSRRPGISAEVMRDLHAADRTLGLRRPAAPQPTRDPYRYDPNRLLPRSALVRRVHVDRVVVEAPQPVAQLCATLGLVYAERHIAAQLADWNTMVPEKRGDTAKAGASL